jgi:hypothetical protein
MGRTGEPNEAMIEARMRSLTSGSCQLMGIVASSGEISVRARRLLSAGCAWTGFRCVELCSYTPTPGRRDVRRSCRLEKEEERLTSCSVGVLCRCVEGREQNFPEGSYGKKAVWNCGK